MTVTIIDSTYVTFAISMIFGVVLGGLTQWFTKLYIPELPYTVCLFIEGAIITFSLRGTDMYSVESFISNSSFISSIILYMFLPILIFGEAMNLNWHHVMSGLIQSLWLAGPGVVVGALLMAVAAMYFMNWSFAHACIFGAILSATDPVAVVALLKTAGASHQLTILITGESILNDGSAIVLYELFVQIASGVPPTGQNVIIFFLTNAVCSVLLGIGIGLFTNKLMRFLDGGNKKVDIAVQICVTILTAYLSFIVAQQYIEISGVLCSATAGLMLARYAPPFILYHSQMHHVWSILEWVCNTLIFFIAGLVSADRMWQFFKIEDIWEILIMYIILMGIRVIMVVLFYPILSRGKLTVTVHDSIFIVWAGLRGALGIALALGLTSLQVINASTSNEMLVHVVGCVSLTLLINASFAKTLLSYLGLSEELRTSNKEIELILELMQERFSIRMKKSLKFNISPSATAYGCNHSSVTAYCTLLAKYSDAERPSYDLKNDIRMQLLALNTNASSQSMDGLGLNPYLCKYLRQQFYENLRTYYLNSIKDGTIQRASYSSQALLSSLDEALDFTDQPLQDWKVVSSTINNMGQFVEAVGFYTDNVINKILGYKYSYLKMYFISRKLRRIMYILTNYIDAHEFAQVNIPTFLGGSEKDAYWLTEELTIKNESIELVDKAKAYLNSQFQPETTAKFYEQRAARSLLNNQSSLVRAMVKEGSLNDFVASKILGIIEKDQIKLNKLREDLNREFISEYMRSSTLESKSIVGRELIMQQFDQLETSFRGSIFRTKQIEEGQGQSNLDGLNTLTCVVISKDCKNILPVHQDSGSASRPESFSSKDISAVHSENVLIQEETTSQQPSSEVHVPSSSLSEKENDNNFINSISNFKENSNSSDCLVIIDEIMVVQSALHSNAL